MGFAIDTVSRGALAAALTALMAGTALGQTVNITGTVTDGGGNPITAPRPKVTLKTLTLNTYCDDAGVYSLVSQTAAWSAAPVAAGMPELRNNQLLFSVAQPEQVVMTVHSVSGAVVNSFSQRLEPGSYAINPIPAGASQATYVVRLTLGGAKHVLRCVGMGANGSGVLARTTGSVGALARSAAPAAVDTLLFERSGFVTKKLAVDTYTGTHDMVMDVYNVMVTTDGHGTTVPAGMNPFTHGVATLVTATPSAGWAFKAWTVGSGSISFGDSSLPAANVTASGPGTIRATFQDAYDTIGCEDVKAVRTTILTRGVIDTTIPAGSILLFRTNDHTLGKMKITGYLGADSTHEVIVSWVAYDSATCAVVMDQPLDTLPLVNPPADSTAGFDIDGNGSKDAVWLRASYAGNAKYPTLSENNTFSCRFLRVFRGQ